MLIGICGGIGSGKSVVSRILRLRGFAVYDCDSEARRIMDESEEVLSALNVRFGDDVCPAGGPINRSVLSKYVFGSDDVRLWLNALVHRLVREDITLWMKYPRQFENESLRKDILYVESAILASSGLVALCDEIWIITAPEEERISRVKTRDNFDENDIRRRIRSQQEEEKLIYESGIPIRVIDNSSSSSLLSQINIAPES